MQEQVIENYLRFNFPDVTEKEFFKIYNDCITHSDLIDFTVKLWKRRLQVKEWNQRKDKNYYFVNMLNGGKKVVYMCPEMVDDFHKYHGYTLIK